MNSASSAGRARLRFGRYDYAAFITYAAYAAFALIPFSFLTMVALVLLAAPSRGGDKG